MPETERKFRVHGLFRLPALDGPEGIDGVASVRAGGELDLHATYYDTADLRLARSHVTLRRRTGGSDEGWHLKLPTDHPETRTEMRCPLGSGEEEPPAELTDLVIALTRGSRIEPVAELRTQRSVVDLLDESGDVLAELTDDSVSVLDGDHVAARFREIEVELGTATSGLLDAVEVLLAQAGAVPGGYASKVSRALGPLASAPPDLVEPDAPRPQDPAGAVVQAHLAKNVLTLLEMDRQVRLDEPDSVHQMRVAARRIRSGLKTFAPLVEESWATGIREEVAWIAGILGAVRDREVLRVRLLSDLERVSKNSPEIEVAAAARVIDRALTDETAAARAGVLEVLRSARYVELLETLHQAALAPQLTAAADETAARSLPPLVRRAWRRLDHAVTALSPESDEHLWHEARIKAKQTRYAAEAVAPVFGKPAKRFADQVERVTELLGEHQDAAVAAHTVSTMASGRKITGPVGFALGLLHSFEQETMAGQRKEFRRMWQDVSRPHWRAWLKP